MEVDEIVQVKLAPAPRIAAPDFPELAPFSRRKSRRRRRVVRFVVWEGIALLALVAFVVGATAPTSPDHLPTTPFGFGVFISAAALAIIPVIFFGLPRRHAQLRRYR